MRAESIADYRGVHKQGDFIAGREQILSLLQRRPCTRKDIALALGLHLNEVVKHLEELTTEGLIETRLTDDALFYRAKRRDG